MSAAPVRRRGLVATALAAAESFLLEPVETGAEPAAPQPPSLRPVVSVFALAPGCGATVVSRALAAELAVRDPAGAAVVAAEGSGGGVALGTPAAGRLARALGSVGAARPAGRLCLVTGADPLRLADAARGLAPVVLDAGHVEVGGVAASVADRAVLVASPAVQPALVSVAADAVARVGPRPLTVVNRDRGEPREGDADLLLPESRMGAQLALGGRGARGVLGDATARLADLCGAAR
jgi:hypothetical protein